MWQYFLIGLIQGIVEWLPVSSEGVVALTSHFLNLTVNPLNLALFLHLGTGLAALIYFRHEWGRIFKLENPRLLKFLLIATVVSVVISFPLYNYLTALTIGPILLLITGFGLLFTAFFQDSQPDRKTKFKHLAWLGGILQGLAVIPGFSRSGGTIFALSLGKLETKQILKISYMMAVPVSLGAGFYLMLTDSVSLLNGAGLIALAVSFIIGLLSLKFLVYISEQINFFWLAFIFSLLCFGGYALQTLI